MSAQLATYIVLSIPLHHASTLQERAFVLKNVALIKTFPLDSTDIMCLSINTSKGLTIYRTFLSLNLLQVMTL
jgi:hypothetical protein